MAECLGVGTLVPRGFSFNRNFYLIFENFGKIELRAWGKLVVKFEKLKSIDSFIAFNVC